MNIMNHSFAIKFIAACAALAGAGGVFSQHTGPGEHTVPDGTATAQTPYAGQQARDIKALSARDAQDLIDGKGMGLALAAELNGYPGPMHVLEHARALGLSDAQRDSSARLMAAHKEEARALGRQLVEAERELDQAFATRQIEATALRTRLQRIGALQAAIRDAHLQTHLTQTALLTPAQIARYNQLRGYGTAGATHRH